MAAPSGNAPGDGAADRTLLINDRLEIDRLSAALDAAEQRIAGLQADFDALRADAMTPYARKLEARIAELVEGHAALVKENRRLVGMMHHHWATHPGAQQAWENRAPGADPYGERQRMFRSRLVEMLAEPRFASGDRRVTVVVTSCKRHDLLERTLESFFTFNTAPIEKVIVIEDGDQPFSAELQARFADQPMVWLRTVDWVGQIRAIDIAYRQVDTPYIFHMEDDWEFLRPGFIEDSMTILEAEPLCLQVWLRGRPPPTSHPYEEPRSVTGGVTWRRLAKGHHLVWHGFSFNPGLKRLRDYELIGGAYAGHVDPTPGAGAVAEERLSQLYHCIGYFAAAIWVDDGAAHVGHLGEGRRVS